MSRLKKERVDSEKLISSCNFFCFEEHSLSFTNHKVIPCLLNRNLFTFCRHIKEKIGPTEVWYLVYIPSVGRQDVEVKRESYAAVFVQDVFQSLARFAAGHRGGQMSWFLHRLETRMTPLCGDWGGSGGKWQSWGWAHCWWCGALRSQWGCWSRLTDKWWRQPLLKMLFGF